MCFSPMMKPNANTWPMRCDIHSGSR
jgi:hypothetical protein